MVPLGSSAPARAQVMDHDAVVKAQRQQREMQLIVNIANPDVRAAALDQLKQVTGKELTFDLGASEAARPAAVAELPKQLAGAPATEPVKP